MIVNMRYRGKLETLDKFFEQSDNFKKIKFNVASLDKLTDGGLDTGVITELYGHAGTGKTQLCMQLALNCQLPHDLGGADAKVVFISTDKHTSVKRLQEMAIPLRAKAPHIKFFDNIFLYEFNTKKALEWFMKQAIYQILVYRRENIRLFIIDSIAGIYRTDTAYIQRAKHIRKHFKTLTRLAKQFGFAIVTTNHITTVPGVSAESKGRDIPAIGRVWASKTSSRLCVTKMKAKVKLSTDGSNVVDTSIRKLEIIKSTRLPRSSAYFVVTSHGVESVAEKEE
jgi:RecA/RadA recombinase